MVLICSKTNQQLPYDVRFSVVDAAYHWTFTRFTTIRYDTIGEFNMDSKAEYTA